MEERRKPSAFTFDVGDSHMLADSLDRTASGSEGDEPRATRLLGGRRARPPPSTHRRAACPAPEQLRRGADASRTSWHRSPRADGTTSCPPLVMTAKIGAPDRYQSTSSERAQTCSLPVRRRAAGFTVDGVGVAVKSCPRSGNWRRNNSNSAAATARPSGASRSLTARQITGPRLDRREPVLLCTCELAASRPSPRLRSVGLSR